MKRRAEIDRYALYGEGNGAIPPEFVHIEPISTRSSLHEWHIAAHAHPGIFQILVLQRGGALLMLDGAQVQLAPVSVVAVPSGAVHAFRFDPGAEGWVLSMADALLHDARLSPFRLAEPQGPAARHRQLPEDAAQAARLGWVLADLAAAPAGDGQGAIDPVAMAELALALALVDSLLVGGGQLGGERVSRHEELVARFRRLVEVHFRQGWAVERYAASLATTAPTLTRACRSVLGRAPGEVVLDRLLLEAMRSLTYTSASVSQIAEALGFADPAYFARFFKARAGVTASAFRADRGWLGAVPG